jgi:predicted phosphoadenosine phosphosulfate sulfurtransferase
MEHDIIIFDTQSKMKQVLEENINIGVAVSGGSDSDFLIDLFERSEYRTPEHTVNYHWFDTGLEYQATKDHLDF